jgi:hypothetical protein
VNGTHDAILEENPPWRYLAGRADPPPVKARRTRMPQMRLYARADYQTEILPAIIGETAADDQPALYQVGGKLRDWCDANCLRETEPASSTS